MDTGKSGTQRIGYEIRVQGTLDAQWAAWFEGWTMCTTDCEETVLTGLVRDQPALFGLLARIRDLGLPLLLVRRIDLEFTDVARRHLLPT